MVALVREEKVTYSGSLLDIRNDLVFKAVFGTEKNKDILLMLLNAIVTDKIEEIIFLDSHLGAEYVDDKYSVLDIRVRTTDKVELNVEMQLEYHTGFENRMLLYWAKMYVGHLKAGESYAKMKKTIQISITNFEFLENDHFHSTFQLFEKEKRINFTDHLEIHVLELPKVKLSEDQVDEDVLTRWMLFLSGNDKIKEALAMRDPGIDRAFGELNRISEDEVMRERAISREKFLSDQATRKELAWLEGQEKGIEKGIEKGKEKGKEEAVLGMANEGLSVKLIAKVMKISEEKVSEIINSGQ